MILTKEWDKYRVAFVLQGKPHYVEEDDKVINTKVCIKSTIFWYFWYLTAVLLQEFRGMALQSHGPQQAGRPWIGLEHTNKVGISLHLLLFTLFLQANKRSRYTYMEKSIKIYNWALRHPVEPLQVWEQSELKQVNHSDFKWWRKHPVPQPMGEKCRALFLFWTVQSAFSCFKAA